MAEQVKRHEKYAAVRVVVVFLVLGPFKGNLIQGT